VPQTAGSEAHSWDVRRRSLPAEKCHPAIGIPDDVASFELEENAWPVDGRGGGSLMNEMHLKLLSSPDRARWLKTDLLRG
jgi:hypothetical protein